MLSEFSNCLRRTPYPVREVFIPQIWGGENQIKSQTGHHLGLSGSRPVTGIPEVLPVNLYLILNLLNVYHNFFQVDCEFGHTYEKPDGLSFA